MSNDDRFPVSQALTNQMVHLLKCSEIDKQEAIKQLANLYKPLYRHGVWVFSPEFCEMIVEDYLKRPFLDDSQKEQGNEL
jgi:hypothetical protein